MNKNTLATLKNELKGYHTALPVFEMKEQQLKEIIQTIENTVNQLQEVISNTNEEVKKWAGVMTDDAINLEDIVVFKGLNTTTKEVAGVVILQFQSIQLEQKEIDFFTTPLWVDAAIEAIKDQKTNLEILKIESKNLETVSAELAEARRMKNALKEVFIPETQENIRKIEIYLGDVERLAIGCAKLVKKKKQSKGVLL